MKRPQSNHYYSVNPELEKLAKAISKAVPRFETIDQTLVENAIRVKALREFGNLRDKTQCLELADKLKNCSPEEVCGSMACSLCQRYRRLKFMQKWLPYIEEHQNDYKAVTLISYADMFSNSTLFAWDLGMLKQRLLKAIQRIGFNAPVIGGFEMDYHNYTHEPERSHWMPHLHLIMPNEPEKLEMLRQYMLRKKNLLAREGKRNRPMRIDEIENVERQMSYCITGIWMEYPWFLNADNKLKKSKEPRRIKSAGVYAKSLVKLDRLSDGMLTFAVNVQVG
ncbi:hypothetical protein [Pantoea septica]|uniref:hypothetical protein n=1 Tax=Pantoea septica TaxID=472695 RepID=UPI0028D328D6|nr:hypothetical protein [Pantoea septica]